MNKALKLTMVFCVLIVLGYFALCFQNSRNLKWMNKYFEKNGLPAASDTALTSSGHDLFTSKDADNNGINNEEQAVLYARAMVNTPYDPFMGRFNNILGKAGFIVCTDVPVRSYLWAGVPLPSILRESVIKHPEWFEIDANNSPNTMVFYRRVRNYYSLFKNHPDLELSDKPKPGDLAFYGKYHIGIMMNTYDNGNYEVVETDGLPPRVVISDRKFMEKDYPDPPVYGRIRYNRQENQK